MLPGLQGALRGQEGPGGAASGFCLACTAAALLALLAALLSGRSRLWWGRGRGSWAAGPRAAPQPHTQRRAAGGSSAGLGCHAARPPHGRIVIMVAGTRGDVQPAAALALRLQQDGHTVRLATHEAHRQLVLQAGVRSFYPLGGCPRALTQVAIQAGGMLPKTWASFCRVRAEYARVIPSCWEAATCWDAEAGGFAKPSLIITTPITYGAPYVAEALRVPLHVISAVPWMPSAAVPHPWARAWDRPIPELAVAAFDAVLPPWQRAQAPPAAAACATGGGSSGSGSSSSSNGSVQGGTWAQRAAAWYCRVRGRLRGLALRWANWASTPLLDHCVWLGIADLLVAQRLRLGLGPLSHGCGLYRHPTTLTFSPLLLPRPADWGGHVCVSGPLTLASLSSHHAAPGSMAAPTAAAPAPAAATADAIADASGSSTVCCEQAVEHTSASSSAQERALSGSTLQGLPAELEAFLRAGPAPVYIGFGSACDMEMPGLLHAVTAAALRTGTRILLDRGMLQGSALLTPVGRALAGEGGAAGRGGACAGSGGANSSSGGASSSGSASCEGQPLSELVCVVDSLPHEWVLPRCSGAVHHGGIGHVLSCLAAGIPMLVAPCYGDNFFNGELVAARGCGPRPVPASCLDVRALEQALVTLREETPYTAAARAMGAALARAPRGVDLAVEHIYRHLPGAAANSADAVVGSQPLRGAAHGPQPVQPMQPGPWARVRGLWGSLARARKPGAGAAKPGSRGAAAPAAAPASAKRTGQAARGPARGSAEWQRWVPWPIGDGLVRM